MGQMQSLRRERKELFGNKTVEHLQNNFTEAKRKSEKRKKKRSKTVIFKTSYPFASLPIFEKPVCLISNDEDGSLNIDEEALRQIREIKVPLVIVAIAGLYRTGKSYLMNRLAGRSEGFALGNSIQAKTKGIWVWCRRHPQLADHVLMLLDTEGLGDVAKGDIGNDNRIFTLAALLCNVLVYNIMHAFNQDAVEKLTFIAEISNNLSFKNNSDVQTTGEQMQLILPKFVLCLRDFALKLEIDGQTITPDQYLEGCLQSKSIGGAGNERYNKPRECIRKYFATRKCFTFDSPGTREVIQKLEQMDLQELPESFRKDTESFLEYINSCEPKQLLHSKSVTGQMFATLAESYVNAIKAGGVPDVDDAFLAVSNFENDRLAKEAVEEFRKHLVDVSLPIPKAEELDQLRQDFVDESLKNFRSQAVLKSKDFEEKAIMEMNSLWNEIKERNLQLAIQFCEKQLDDVYTEILEKKLHKKKYHKSGGFEKYKKDREEVEAEFKKRVKEFDDFVVKGVICSLAQNLKQIEEEIMNADKKLDKEEKENLMKSMQKHIDDAKMEQTKLMEQHKQAEEMREKEHQRQLKQARLLYEKQEEQNLNSLRQQLQDHQEQQRKQIDTLTEQLMEQRRRQEQNDGAFITIQIPDPLTIVGQLFDFFF